MEKCKHASFIETKGKNKIRLEKFGKLMLANKYAVIGSTQLNRTVRNYGLEVSRGIPRRMLVLDWSSSFIWIFCSVQLSLHFGTSGSGT